MRLLAALVPVLLAGCSSLPPAQLHGMSVEPRHPTPTLERPWLVPMPRDEVTLFDSRTLQALRKLDEIEALSQNANGRRVRRPAMWAGIGIGAAAGLVVIAEAIDDAKDLNDDFWDCFFDSFFGGGCGEADDD
jgi:hypothetical protein